MISAESWLEIHTVNQTGSQTEIKSQKEISCDICKKLVRDTHSQSNRLTDRNIETERKYIQFIVMLETKP